MRARTLSTWLSLALFAPCVAVAELPTWDETADQLFVIRYDCSDSSEYQNGTWGRSTGIWRFDPESGNYQRLHPFWFNIDDNTSRCGAGSFLAGGDGRLVFQAWPYSLDLDLAPLRILRRYAPMADPAAVGWAVQGPLLTGDAALPLGLQPGVYGFAECLAYQMTINLGWPPSWPVPCSEYPFAGFPPPSSHYERDTSVLLRRGISADNGLVDFVAETPSDPWALGWEGWAASVPPILSFDPNREGFWLGLPRGVHLLPTADGQVGPFSEWHAFDFPPFDLPTGRLDALFFHPTRRVFLGVAMGYTTELVAHAFFSLDEEAQPLTTFEARSYGAYQWDQIDGMPITFASPGPRPSAHQQMVPIVTRSQGENGTFWRSDLWLFNPSGEPVTVEVRRVTAPDQQRSLGLPAKGSLRVTDALTWCGGGPEGDGVVHDALVFTTPFRWGEQVVVSSRVFTPEPGGAGGTLGQAVPAVPSRLGYSNHLPYIEDPEGHNTYAWVHEPGIAAANLTLDEREPGRFRHNLGVVNDSEAPLIVTVVWGFRDQIFWGDDPPPPDEAVRRLTVAPRQVAITALEGLFPAAVQEVRSPRLGVFAERATALWMSMVDNITGDATFVPFTNYNFFTYDEDDRAALPVAVHSPGRNGTTWTTDLFGVQGSRYYSSDEQDRPLAFFHPGDPAGQCGGAALGGEIRQRLLGIRGCCNPLLGYGWRTVFPDVVHRIEVCSEDDDVKGALEVSTASWMNGYSRTYTTREDDGTYGDMLPFYPLGGWPVQHFAGVEVSEQFRVNVGLFNGDHEHAIAHRLTLYAADGTMAAERTLTLQPLASYQRSLDHIFGCEDGTLPHGTYGLTVLPLDDDAAGVQGHCWAYVSLVDNLTGDPTNWW